MTLPATERLLFRNWIPADLAPFHSICSDPAVMQFVGDGQTWSLEKTDEFILRAVESAKTFGFCQWPLVDKESRTLIGFCGFVPASDGAEIGWRLAKAYWGKGLATEAARAALRYGFETLGFDRITATVQSPNLPSIRIVEKLGMKPESRFQRNEREVIQFSLSRQSNAAF